MSGIRKQAIISSILVYIGIPFGALNTYFFVKQGAFTSDQYGLTRLFNDMGQNFYVIASLGVIPIIYKFYPYYKDNLPNEQNDLLGRAFIKSLIGFLLLTVACFFFEPLVVRKFSSRSALFVDYYFWVLPYAFGMLFFSLLEGYAWALQKTILSNFLKETGIRLFTTVFIVLYFLHVVDFHGFMLLFSVLYMLIAVILLVHLIRTKKFHFSLKKSRVTQKFRKKIFAMQALIFGGIIITTVGQTVDGMIISSLLGLSFNGIYNLALYTANLIQIPQRSIQSISIGVLVRMWKEKNFPEIRRIYQRSSINMLLISLFIFGNVWLNVRDGLAVLHIQNEYATGIPALLLFGIIRIIDAGTGVNGQIIGASNFWRFEFVTGIIMLALRIPLSYIFIKRYGIIGSAYGDLISLSVYNYIRYDFLRRKFNMQPFTWKTVYSLLVGFAAYYITYYIFRMQTGWFAIVGRSVVFSSLLVAAIFAFRLTPDALQLYEVARKRLGWVK